MTRGKQPLCQTREVCVEGEEGAISRSGNGRRKSGDGGRKGGRSVEVANATMREGC